MMEGGRKVVRRTIWYYSRKNGKMHPTPFCDTKFENEKLLCSRKSYKFATRAVRARRRCGANSCNPLQTCMMEGGRKIVRRVLILYAYFSRTFIKYVNFSSESYTWMRRDLFRDDGPELRRLEQLLHRVHRLGHLAPAAPQVEVLQLR